jgi:transcriptional regulator with XRE-family HTH domain
MTDIEDDMADSQGRSWHIRLDSLIAEKGWANAELERRSGVPRKRIGEYRAGKSEPSGVALARMAKALGTTVEYLITGEDPLAGFGSAAAAGRERAIQLSEAQGRAFDPVIRPRPVPGGGAPSAYDRAALTFDAATRIARWEPPEEIRIALMNILVHHDISADQLAILLTAIAPPE